MIVELFCSTYGWTISEVLDDHTFGELQTIMNARKRNADLRDKEKRSPVQQELPQRETGVHEERSSGQVITPTSKEDFESLAEMGAPVKVISHGNSLEES